jgi:flavin reductase ActVB
MTGLLDQRRLHPVSSQAFKDAMARLPSPVTIVTCAGPRGEPVGMTVSSVTSVSAEPPLLLWCVARSARRYALMRTARRFIVHLLTAEQHELATMFATTGADKFSDSPTAGDDPPRLLAAPIALTCSHWQTYDGGDHDIVLGRVDAISHSPDSVDHRGLIWQHRAFHGCNPLTSRSTQPPVKGA